MRFIALITCFGFVLLLLAACGSEESIPKSASTLVSPESSPKAQRMPAGPDQDAAILEEGGNINLALWLAQSGMGTWIVGDPTAVYGGIMTYRAALEAVRSGIRLGPSQAWKLDREVYVYLFEGEFTDSMTGTQLVTDWAQTIIFIDAETGEYYGSTDIREPARRDVSQLQQIRILDHVKGVAPRGVDIDPAPLVTEPPATVAPGYEDDE